jgi:hypothetical protein
MNPLRSKGCHDGGISNESNTLSTCGYVLIEGPFLSSQDARAAADAVVDSSRQFGGFAALTVIGDFLLPPADGKVSRDFQTLHFDFGLPLDPKLVQDYARYTALHIPADTARVVAVTRLVPLASLLSQRSWPTHKELVQRLCSYGRSHGAWEDDRGYVEGSLARIVEAAAIDQSPLLPSVKGEPGFLCGLEFDSLHAEDAFFERLGLCIREVEIEVALQPGELLVFDNLAHAHGRRGTRQPGELRQWMFGNALDPMAQRRLRDDVLAAFHSSRSARSNSVPHASMP